MNKIILKTVINAPIERCFNLSTSIDLHKLSAFKTKEEAIKGRKTGLIKLNESVTWKAKHFGMWHHLTVKISKYNKPNSFTDEMTKGSFKHMRHLHLFETKEGATVMTDIFEFSSPFGIIGKLVDKLILKNYMTRFLEERNIVIKKYAESNDWKLVLKNKH